MKALLEAIAGVGAIAAFFFDVVRTALTRPHYVGETLRIMWILVGRCIIPVGLAVIIWLMVVKPF